MTRTARQIAVLWGLTIVVFGYEVASATASSDEINGLATAVQGLGDKSFRVRERSMQTLRAGGLEALPHLVAALNSDDAEQVARSAHLLRRFLESENPNMRSATRAAFEDLASLHRKVPPRIRALLQYSYDSQRQIVTSKLRKLGASVKYADKTQPKTPTSEISIRLSSRFKGNADTLRLLKDYPDLRALSLTGSKVSDDYLKVLGELPKVEKIDLKGTAILGTKLDALAKLENLTDLDLTNTLVNNQALPHIAKLASLKHLNLSDTLVADSAPQQLVGLPQLETLDLSKTRTSPAGFTALVKCPSLRKLNAAITHFDKPSLVKLAGAAKLESINVMHTNITRFQARDLQLRFAQLNILSESGAP